MTYESNPDNFQQDEESSDTLIYTMAAAPGFKAGIAGRAFAGYAGGLNRTEDGGQTWTRHRPGAVRDCHSMTFHVTNGDWIYESGGTGVAVTDAGADLPTPLVRSSG